MNGATELSVVNEVEGLLRNCEFSEVFILEVLIDLSFVSVVLLFEFELSNVLLSVDFSDVEEFSALFDLSLSS